MDKRWSKGGQGPKPKLDKSWSKDTQKLPKSWSKPRGPREIVKQFRGVEKDGQGRDCVAIAPQASPSGANIKMQNLHSTLKCNT